MLFSNKGVLGINARNLLYIRPYNPKKAIRLADDKIKTKQFLSTRGIPVPKLYNIIRENSEIDQFDFNILPNTFVVKPNTGFGGEGIIPIIDRKDGNYVTAANKKLDKEDLKDHLRDILDGHFSISSVGDSAFFEQYIIADERVGKYSYEGLPDIRVIVHNLIPVMAMLRLPTKESEGKANLHMGAVGVGIDIAKGQTTYISYKNRIIEELPDHLGKIKGVKIPFWDEILMIASKVQLITNLGYMAIDICIDKNIGPVLLEINARAGLGVQIANLAPLRKRLERIQGVKVTSPKKGVRIAKDMFGNIVEKEIQNLSGKTVINNIEDVEIIDKTGTFRIKAKVDTGKKISILDQEIAIKQGLLDNEKNYEDEKSTLKLKFLLKEKRLQTIVEVEKISNKEYKMILGRRDLKDFLIDVGAEVEKKIKKQEKKPEEEQKAQTNNNINFYEIDQRLAAIDSKIKLLYHLRPLNLESEKTDFFNRTIQNPQFEYPALKFDPFELIDELNKIKTNSSPLGKIFEEKRLEILNKINLLTTIGEEDFTSFSIKLFGKPEIEDYQKCHDLINKLDVNETRDLLQSCNAEQAREKFEKAFEKYGLNQWKIKIKEGMVADCVAGKNNRLFLKSDAKFTEERIENLIVHEIETHIITAENGKIQGYEIFNRGTGQYLMTQEGLAMYNVEQQRKEPFEKNLRVLSNVLAIFWSLSSGFKEVYQKLLNLNILPEQAFRSVLKAKRGLTDTGKSGTFTKDFIYYKGYSLIKNFVENGGDLKHLYLGKIAIKDLETALQIPGIQKAKILPIWL